jgi:hypothetical protein
MDLSRSCSQDSSGIRGVLNLILKSLLILCSKPSAELFHVFDRLLLLRKGGQTVFMGDIGPNATGLIHYFELNGSRACKPDENPYVSRQLTKTILMYS